MKSKRIAKGTGRERLLSSATELFLENGFESTSPQAIYAKSGVGQGSFYHHFSGKIDLMNAVLLRLVESELTKLEVIEAQTESPIKRINLYLDVPRTGAKGCKFGRFVYETSAGENELSEPIIKYFDSLIGFLTRSILVAQEQGLISRSLSPQSMAKLIVTQVQGSFVLARMYQDDSILTECLTNIRLLLGIPTQC